MSRAYGFINFFTHSNGLKSVVTGWIEVTPLIFVQYHKSSEHS